MVKICHPLYVLYHGRWSISTLPPHNMTPTLCIVESNVLILSDIAAATAAPEAASITTWEDRRIPPLNHLCQVWYQGLNLSSSPNSNTRMRQHNPIEPILIIIRSTGVYIFSYFASKHKFWVFVTTAISCTHNLHEMAIITNTEMKV